jgi:hypothetical protein
MGFLEVPFIVYSYKGRGVCPWCNTLRTGETAAHLSDHVFPRLPLRQWVLSVPKRLPTARANYGFSQMAKSDDLVKRYRPIGEAKSEEIRSKR